MGFAQKLGLFSFLVGIGGFQALADYYPSYYQNGYGYRGGQTRPPIISLDLDPKDNLNSSFRLAAREERIEDMIQFLNDKAEINSQSDEGDTALMYAARNCSRKTVKALMSRGAILDIEDNKGRTALIYAAQASCLPVIKILLHTRDLNVAHRDREGKSALDYALDNTVLDVDGPSFEAVRRIQSYLSGKTINKRKLGVFHLRHSIENEHRVQ